MEIDDVYECPKCNQRITVPPEMTQVDQDRISSLCRTGKRIEAWSLIRFEYRLGLSESKLMMMHVSVPRHRCANCGNQLLETGITYCPSCSGLNLNW